MCHPLAICASWHSLPPPPKGRNQQASAAVSAPTYHRKSVREMLETRLRCQKIEAFSPRSRHCHPLLLLTSAN
eukprot:763940-Hanusia_phi.AAC.13